MALVTLSGLVNDLRGSLGGSTFSRSCGGLTVRSKNAQSKLTQKLPTNQRAVVGVFTQLWHVQDLSFRERWIAFAIANPTPQRRNAALFLSGYQLYLQCHFNSYQFTQSFTPFYPDTIVPATCVITVDPFDTTLMNCKVAVTPSMPSVAFKVAYSFSVQMSAGRASSMHRYRLLNVYEGDTYILYDFYADYVALYGTPPIGSLIQVKVAVVGGLCFESVATSLLTTLVV